MKRITYLAAIVVGVLAWAAPAHAASESFTGSVKAVLGSSITVERGTISVNRLVANHRGLRTRPSLKSASGCVELAEAKTSAGAPLRICRASASEPAKLYRGPPSILGKTSPSDAAANTLMPLTADVAGGNASATSAAAKTAARVKARP